MNKSVLMATAAILTASLPQMAYAEMTAKSQSELRAEAATTGNIVKDADKAAADMKHDFKEAAKEIKAFFLSEDEKVKPELVSYAGLSSASGILGAEVHNTANVRVGRMEDLIVDSQGNIKGVIVADNDIPGMKGKLVMLPYERVSRQDKTGDIITPLTEEVIKDAKAFTYDPSGEPTETHLVKGQYSVKGILDGAVVDKNGTNLGAVDDLYLKGGKVDSVIIGFDKVVGLGGEDVAVSYAPTTLSPQGDRTDVVLTTKQAAAFGAYKATATK